MSDTFAAPAPPSEGIQWEALFGRLLLIEPTSIELGIETQYGPKDAVRANVTVIDGDNPGDERTDTLIFPKVLVSQIRGVQGFPNVKVLGRLEQGEAKRGQKPPWRLAQQLSPADHDLGQRYLAHRSSQGLQQPASAAPQPQPAPQPQQQAPQQQWPQQAAGAMQQPAQQSQNVPF